MNLLPPLLKKLESELFVYKDWFPHLPDGVADQDSICYYFDKHWQNTSEESAVYKMRLVCSASDKVKEIQVTFEKLQNANEETSLYTQTIRFLRKYSASACQNNRNTVLISNSIWHQCQKILDIAVSSFQIDALENTFYRITLTDTDGHCSSFLLHPGVPA